MTLTDKDIEHLLTKSPSRPSKDPHLEVYLNEAGELIHRLEKLLNDAEAVHELTEGTLIHLAEASHELQSFKKKVERAIHGHSQDVDVDHGR